ncbi:MAG: ATP synthase F0 subunit B [Candidatus Roizmanbacteria bacterium]|nr:ATP synthase F0 subunit B [Candidatus Roizmanbacteria bacterium]
MEKLGINGGLLLAQTINFVIVLVVYLRYVHKPFLKKIKAEHEKHTQLERLVREAKEQEAVLLQKQEAMQQETEQKLKKEYAAMKKEVDVAKRSILKEAHEEADRIREHNMEMIEQEKNKMLTEVRGDVVRIASLVLEKALQGMVRRELQEKVTKEVIAQLPKVEQP